MPTGAAVDSKFDAQNSFESGAKDARRRPAVPSKAGDRLLEKNPDGSSCVQVAESVDSSFYNRFGGSLGSDLAASVPLAASDQFSSLGSSLENALGFKADASVECVLATATVEATPVAYEETKVDGSAPDPLARSQLVAERSAAASAVSVFSSSEGEPEVAQTMRASVDASILKSRRRTCLPPSKVRLQRFNFMVCGPTGSGKTSFAKGLIAPFAEDSFDWDMRENYVWDGVEGLQEGVEHARADHNDDDDDEDDASERSAHAHDGKPTDKIRSSAPVFCRSGDDDSVLAITVTDTKGFGDGLNNENDFQPVLDHIEERHMMYLKSEVFNHSSNICDPRIHAVFYCISPHRTKYLDELFLQRLSDKVPVIPLVLKSDTMTEQERQEHLCDIKAMLEQGGIRIFDFKEENPSYVYMDEIEEQTPIGRLSMANARHYPLVRMKNIFTIINGDRMYRWCLAKPASDKDPGHSDTPRLKSLLFGNSREGITRLLDDANDRGYVRWVKMYRHQRRATISMMILYGAMATLSGLALSVLYTMLRMDESLRENDLYLIPYKTAATIALASVLLMGKTLIEWDARVCSSRGLMPPVTSHFYKLRPGATLCQAALLRKAMAGFVMFVILTFEPRLVTTTGRFLVTSFKQTLTSEELLQAKIDKLEFELDVRHRVSAMHDFKQRVASYFRCRQERAREFLLQNRVDELECEVSVLTNFVRAQRPDDTLSFLFGERETNVRALTSECSLGVSIWDPYASEGDLDRVVVDSGWQRL